MELKRKSWLFIVVIATLFFSLYLNVSPLWAKTVTETQKGLTLSPLRSELGINPGSSLDGDLVITNSTQKTMTVDLTAEEFSVINQHYDYAFSARSDIAKWINFHEPEISLAAGESKKVKYTIGVPISAEPGGRYISLFASTSDVGDDSSVNLRQRIASLLYVTIVGSVTRSGNLVSLSSPVAVGGQSHWSAVVRNSGTTHFHSRYSLQLINLLSGKIERVSSSDALILPGSLRLIVGDLPSPPLPGFYKLIYTIGLGDMPAKVVTRYALFLEPLVALSILIIILSLIAAFIYRRRSKKA